MSRSLQLRRSLVPPLLCAAQGRRSGLPLLAGALVALALGCGESPAVSQPTAPAGPPPDVSVVTVEPTAVAIEDVLPGRVVPRRLAEVRPQVGGILRERLFEEGQSVRAGQPLYRIDASLFRADLAGASASVTRQEATVAQRERDAERIQRLAASGTATPQNVDDAESARALALADLELSRASRARSRLQLGYTVVTAPIGGRIGPSHVSEGALVSPSSAESLATIQQIDEVYVDIRQPASRFEELRTAFESGALVENASVPIQILSMRGEPYALEGRLLFTDISVDPTTSELTLRVLVPNPDLRLLPGMFVRARVAFARDPAAILVPQQAIRHDSTLGANVLVVDANEQVAIRRIQTGRVVQGRQIVREGLARGDRVIVEGVDALRPGTSVHPVEWTMPAASDQTTTAQPRTAQPSAAQPSATQPSATQPSTAQPSSEGDGERR